MPTITVQRFDFFIFLSGNFRFPWSRLKSSTNLSAFYSIPKLSDLYTLSQSKMLKNHTHHSGTYLYSPYMAVPSPPGHTPTDGSLDVSSHDSVDWELSSLPGSSQGKDFDRGLLTSGSCFCMGCKRRCVLGEPVKEPLTWEPTVHIRNNRRLKTDTCYRRYENRKKTERVEQQLRIKKAYNQLFV